MLASLPMLPPACPVSRLVELGHGPHNATASKSLVGEPRLRPISASHPSSPASQRGGGGSYQRNALLSATPAPTQPHQDTYPVPHPASYAGEKVAARIGSANPPATWSCSNVRGTCPVFADFSEHPHQLEAGAKETVLKESSSGARIPAASESFFHPLSLSAAPAACFPRCSCWPRSCLARPAAAVAEVTALAAPAVDPHPLPVVPRLPPVVLRLAPPPRE